jgi:hypothetical protein
MGTSLSSERRRIPIHSNRAYKSFGIKKNTAKHSLWKHPSKYKDMESGLTLVGIVGIKSTSQSGSRQSRQDEYGRRPRYTAIAIVHIFPKDADVKDLEGVPRS